MSYVVVTDSAANLTQKQLKENGILEIPFSYFFGETEYHCEDVETFDDVSYYEAIENGERITTSQINPQMYIERFSPILEKKQDILFVGISSQVSGSFASAQIAREQLLEEFPDRKIELIDSLGAGLGEGLMALKAAKCCSNGMELEETAERIRAYRKKVYQVFVVDSLMHLKRTGRLSNASALVGTMLGVKPLLKGNAEGKIEAFEKVRGRKKSIKRLAEKYFELARNPEHQTIAIAYAGCKEEAEYLMALIREKMPPKEIIFSKYEPMTASHLGPGAIALFFEGDDDVRFQ